MKKEKARARPRRSRARAFACFSKEKCPLPGSICLLSRNNYFTCHLFPKINFSFPKNSIMLHSQIKIFLSQKSMFVWSQSQYFSFPKKSICFPSQNQYFSHPKINIFRSRNQYFSDPKIHVFPDAKINIFHFPKSIRKCSKCRVTYANCCFKWSTP